MAAEFTIAGKSYRLKVIDEATQRDIIRWATPVFEAYSNTGDNTAKYDAVLRSFGNIEPENFTMLREALMGHVTRNCSLGWRVIWSESKRAYVFDDINNVEIEAQIFLRVLSIEIARYYGN
jgi:hypothetical protein